MSYFNNIKQLLIDIAVTILLPVLLVWGYNAWRADETFLVGKGNGIAEAVERGERVKRLLAEIESVRLDASIFDDPVFRALEYYPVEIGTTTFGREFPFTTPEAIKAVKKQRGGQP